MGNDMTRAECMRKCREDAGMTVKQLAELSGVEKMTIYAWEIGNNQPRLDGIIKVCDALGITLDEYVGHRVTDGGMV